MPRRSFTVVGGGQSGLQLAIGLVDAGQHVRLVQDRTAEEVRSGRVMSTQLMFDRALANERALGLDLWGDQCPPVESIQFTVPAADGSGKAVDWNGRLDRPARSVDQRVKVAAFMEEFRRRGGEIVIAAAGTDDLERFARDSDLVVVSTGRGSLGPLFERDPARSPFDRPQRRLAIAYVRGMAPRPGPSAVCFNLVPGVGEYFSLPALTVGGPCDIMAFEAVPGGPMDCWDDVSDPADHLARARRLLSAMLPWEAERCAGVEITDPNGTLVGAFAPVVRRPVGRLPSGAAVLGMADAVCLNDPVTGQGANSASKAAQVYLEAILAHGHRPFDTAFMQRTFDAWWDYARFVVDWTNALLKPPEPHMFRIMAAASVHPALAGRIANGFDQPPDFFPWFAVPEEADRYLAALDA